MTARTPALVVLVALVASLLLVDRDASSSDPARFGRPPEAMPTAGGPGSLTSSWFCAAGWASPEEGTDVVVTVANAGAEARAGTVSWSTGPDARTEVEVDVPALGSVEVAASATVSGPAVSAVVELDGGEVAVEHRLVTPQGSTSAPCASSTSTTWHLANGTTARDATQLLVLFNPFPGDAVVDISLATDEGLEEPDALQGVPVEAGATEVVVLGDVVRRRAVTATTVRARSGGLVVDRVQRFDGSEGRRGLSLTVAAPAPATTWRFPQGGYTGVMAQRFHLYNPGNEEALASLELVPDVGEAPPPADLTIPPRSQLTVDATELGRLPEAGWHSSTVTSTNGVPLVVERSLDGRAPGVPGWTSALGAPVAARRWLVPVGGPSPVLDEWIVVRNEGRTAATASIVGLVGEVLPLEGLGEVVLEAGARRAIRLRELVERAPLPVLVEADEPVTVERVVYVTDADRSGIWSGMAVPLAPAG